MSGTAIIGLQWGDEAKGKIVDIMTAQNDIVVRYQGGANAGHTVVVEGTKYKLSLMPSGIFRPNVKCIIAGGVVINPASLLNEIEILRAAGVEIGGNLMLSDRAHVIFPWHVEEDRIFDGLSSSEAIGTTMRGIGPCYRDKVGRSLAVRLGDLLRAEFWDNFPKLFEQKVQYLDGLKGLGTAGKLDYEEIRKSYKEYTEQLAPYITDTTAYLLDAVDDGKRILFEGAQGSLLDIDHGTFPFVTSSNSSGVGISPGSGVPGSYIRRIIGIIKAYTTRVGGGPFPTEQDNEIGQKIREQGNEYGTVTKRPRRCGWFDAVAVRYTTRLGGITGLSLMLLDVLSGFSELKICTAYELDGKTITHFPSHVDDLRRVVPVYETLPGWQEDITGVRNFDDLPQATKDYVKRIAELIGKPVEIVSVGPDRAQTMILG